MLLFLDSDPENLLADSEDFANNSFWTKTNLVVTADQDTAPDGKVTADLAEPTLASTNSFIASIAVPAKDSFTYTFSIYLRSNTGGNVNLTIFVFDSDLTPAYFSEAITITTSYQRFHITGKTGITSVGAIKCLIGAGSTWEDNEDIFMWGAMFNEGGIAPYRKKP